MICVPSRDWTVSHDFTVSHDCTESHDFFLSHDCALSSVCVPPYDVSASFSPAKITENILQISSLHGELIQEEFTLVMLLMFYMKTSVQYLTE